jgi:hypothetical protein
VATDAGRGVIGVSRSLAVATASCGRASGNPCFNFGALAPNPAYWDSRRYLMPVVVLLAFRTHWPWRLRLAAGQVVVPA